ncbi:MAG: bifunctional pyr operon transcriptional regulator/uracil phosphoribosyltransferase PyrR [Kofleriaceae bacterium]
MPTPRDPMPVRRILADAAEVDRCSRRVADALVGRDVVLVGIRTGGYHWARRLAGLLAAAGHAPPLGALDIALYRDDVTTRLVPEVGASEVPVRLDGAEVVLVDDVLYTGRTVRAALDALLDYGRPRAVRLAVLVDRGHRELPIAADLVGMVCATGADERVRVELAEAGPGPSDRVVVRGPAEGAGG